MGQLPAGPLLLTLLFEATILGLDN